MGKRTYKRRLERISREAEENPVLMDRRAMEKSMLDYEHVLKERDFDSIDEANAFLQDMVASGGPPARQALTPVEQAQDVMYEAWASSGKKRVRLARQALTISEDCADAYVLLAEEVARSPEEAKRLYEQGVGAGERALPPQMFEEEVGNFWSMIETRPYMRARLGLAQCLWLLEERALAIEHLQDMLRLNPNDNQGVRWLLANYLLEEGRDGELGELLARYPDEASAIWLYTRALWLFRHEGATKKANTALRKAMRSNPFVPSYLLGLRELPGELPAYMGVGDESEAIAYVVEAILAWDGTEGALEWLLDAWRKGTSLGSAYLKEQLIEAVEYQVRTSDPPEARETLQHLRSAGYSRREALELMATALAEEMAYIAAEQKPFNRQRYKRFLDGLG